MLKCILFYTVLVFITNICAAQETNIPVDTSLQQTPANKLARLDSQSRKGELQRITSILIARNGKLVFEKYYNGLTENSLHDTRSATKTITGMLVGIAIDRGLIKTEKAPAFVFFTDRQPFLNPDARKSKISIEDLLTMSSLLECNDDNQFSAGNEERMYLTEDYFKFALGLPIKGFAAWLQKPQDAPYGRSFSYCTAGTVLLGGILERSTKMKVDAFAKQYLFDPLEIKNTNWQITPMGLPMTGGGLRLSSRSLLKLGLLYINGGRWSNQQIISSEWINKSITPKANAREGVDYGYLWWLQNFGEKGKQYSSYYMAGNGGSKIVVVPALQLVIVITSTWYGTVKAHQQSESIVTQIIDAFAIE